jgi:hypothetical protein
MNKLYTPEVKITVEQIYWIRWIIARNIFFNFVILSKKKQNLKSLLDYVECQKFIYFSLTLRITLR